MKGINIKKIGNNSNIIMIESFMMIIADKIEQLTKYNMDSHLF